MSPIIRQLVSHFFIFSLSKLFYHQSVPQDKKFFHITFVNNRRSISVGRLIPAAVKRERFSHHYALRSCHLCSTSRIRRCSIFYFLDGKIQPSPLDDGHQKSGTKPMHGWSQYNRDCLYSCANSNCLTYMYSYVVFMVFL